MRWCLPVRLAPTAHAQSMSLPAWRKSAGALSDHSGSNHYVGGVAPTDAMHFRGHNGISIGGRHRQHESDRFAQSASRVPSQLVFRAQSGKGRGGAHVLRRAHRGTGGMFNGTTVMGGAGFWMPVSGILLLLSHCMVATSSCRGAGPMAADGPDAILKRVRRLSSSQTGVHCADLQGYSGDSGCVCMG